MKTTAPHGQRAICVYAVACTYESVAAASYGIEEGAVRRPPSALSASTSLIDRRRRAGAGGKGEGSSETDSERGLMSGPVVVGRAVMLAPGGGAGGYGNTGGGGDDSRLRFLRVA